MQFHTKKAFKRNGCLRLGRNPTFWAIPSLRLSRNSVFYAFVSLRLSRNSTFYEFVSLSLSRNSTFWAFVSLRLGKNSTFWAFLLKRCGRRLNFQYIRLTILCPHLRAYFFLNGRIVFIFFIFVNFTPTIKINGNAFPYRNIQRL